MTVIYKNPQVQKNVNTAEDAGDLVHNQFTFDFAKSYAPGSTALGVGDQIQVGVVPAGEVLVPHLCLLRIPAIDSNGSPTGTAAIGTATTDNALKATASVAAAQTLSGEDFTLTTGPIGADNADTPIYLTIKAVMATQITTGKIIFDQVCRPWDSAFDGASTS